MQKPQRTNEYFIFFINVEIGQKEPPQPDCIDTVVLESERIFLFHSNAMRARKTAFSDQTTTFNDGSGRLRDIDTCHAERETRGIPGHQHWYRAPTSPSRFVTVGREANPPETRRLFTYNNSCCDTVGGPTPWPGVRGKGSAPAHSIPRAVTLWAPLGGPTPLLRAGE